MASSTAGPVLSNVASKASTSGSSWGVIWSLPRPITARKLQIINNGSGTGDAQISIGDRNNPLLVPAGGSLSLDDILIKGPIELMRDASTDIAGLTIQLAKKGGETIDYD